jgi:hypothetical protein
MLDGTLDEYTWVIGARGAWQGDHIACTLINRNTRTIFHRRIGIVVQAHVPIACSYSFDGGTQNKANGGCGSWSGNPNIHTDWCSPGRPWQCSWHADQLDDMMRFSNTGSGYNEVIVLGSVWNQGMPDALAAIIYGSDADVQMARNIHSAFLSKYGKTAQQVPLLFMDVSLDQPFRAT